MSLAKRHLVFGSGVFLSASGSNAGKVLDDALRVDSFSCTRFSAANTQIAVASDTEPLVSQISQAQACKMIRT